jgi:hypothetical protein
VRWDRRAPRSGAASAVAPRRVANESGSEVARRRAPLSLPRDEQATTLGCRRRLEGTSDNSAGLAGADYCNCRGKRASGDAPSALLPLVRSSCLDLTPQTAPFRAREQSGADWSVASAGVARPARFVRLLGWLRPRAASVDRARGAQRLTARASPRSRDTTRSVSVAAEVGWSPPSRRRPSWNPGSRR